MTTDRFVYKCCFQIGNLLVTNRRNNKNELKTSHYKFTIARFEQLKTAYVKVHQTE